MVTENGIVMLVVGMMLVMVLMLFVTGLVMLVKYFASKLELRKTKDIMQAIKPMIDDYHVLMTKTMDVLEDTSNTVKKMMEN